jgi:NADH dehydrogenase
VLPDDPAEPLTGLDVEVVRGTVTDADSFLAHGRGVDAVAHVASLMLPNPAHLIEHVNVTGTANVVRFARQWKVRRLVYVSAVSAAYARTNVYGRSKREAERLVRESGVDYTIIRPTMVYGPGGGLHFQKLVSTMDRLPLVFPVPGPGTAAVQPVWIEDLVRGIELALRLPVATGKTYNAAGATALPFKELIDRLAAAQGKKRLRLHAPLWALYLAARALGPLLGPSSFLSRDALLGINEDASLDYGPFAADCGYTALSLDQGLERLFGAPLLEHAGRTENVA